jgi:tetratricopeptide (TPR) repeat protein
MGDGPRSVDTLGERGNATPSDVTGHPLDELGRAGLEMFDEVCAGLGLKAPAEHSQLGRFVLGRRLGAGGMGIVHLARDPRLDRDVAIKRVRARRDLSSETLRARLAREARTLGRLHHPNLVHVYELGEHEGEVFLAMEYVAGQTLRDWQSQPGRERDELLRAYIGAAMGLAAAHDSQVVHRDFKPENVFVSDEGHVQVGDFGLADLIHELGSSESGIMEGSGQRLTALGEVVGTLTYMAPERLRGERGGARSDQFSFCVALWEALTGELPFAGEGRDDRLAAIEAGPVLFGRSLDRQLRTLLERGLALEPDSRHPSMRALTSMLEYVLGRRRRRVTRGALGLAVVGIALAVWFAAKAWDTDPSCSTLDEVESASEPARWAELQRRLGPEALRLAPVRAHFNQLERRAATLCDDDEAERDEVEAWLADLELLLASDEPDPERLLGRIDWLTERSLRGAPPGPMGDRVRDALQRSVELELSNDLEGALTAAAEAVTASREDFERAEAHLRRARVRALVLDYHGALGDYEQARLRADADGHDDARLRANMRAAELMLERLGEVEGAWAYLANSGSVLTRVGASTMSSRRAELDELRATHASMQGELDRALLLSLSALARRVVAGAPPHLVARSLAGLAVILELRGLSASVEPCYRAALARLPGPSPDRFQVAFMLGRWLSLEERFNEARTLLMDAKAGRVELRLAATTELLKLELVAGAPPSVTTELADEVERMLTEEARGAGPDHRLDALSFVAMARALANDHAALESAMARAHDMLERHATALERARLEISVATLVPDAALQARYAERALSTLESLPPSPERADMLNVAEGLDLAEGLSADGG